MATLDEQIRNVQQKIEGVENKITTVEALPEGLERQQLTELNKQLTELNKQLTALREEKNLLLRKEERAAAAGEYTYQVTGTAQHQQLPDGSVLALQEVFADGTKMTCGTLAIISKTGLAITARHCVVWEDGYIHPLRLCIMGHDETEVQHVRSFPDLDITVLQLAPRARDPLQGQHGSHGEQGQESPSSSGSSNRSTSSQWAWLQPARGQPTDVDVLLYGYASAAQTEALLTPSQPLAVHGKVSHFTQSRLIGVADYQSFPNMSGGPVIWDGRYFGTHTCAVSHSESPTDEPLGPMPRVEADEIVRNDLPVGPPIALAATAGTTRLRERIAVCEARLQQLQVAGECNAQFGLFVPCAAIVARLEECGALPREQEQRELLNRAKRARIKH